MPSTCGELPELGGLRLASSTVPSSKELPVILLVDPQPERLGAHAAVLAELGHSVVPLGSASEACENLPAQSGAVVLLAIDQFDSTVFRSAGIIQDQMPPQHAPIILLAPAPITDADRVQASQLGAVDCLSLPLDPALLKSKVAEWSKRVQERVEMQTRLSELIAHNHDLSEQLESVHKLNRQLRDANKEMESFSSTVAHDLRGPLRHMSCLCQMLLEDYKETLDETACRYLDSLKLSAGSMDQLTRDLLAYSRISHGEIFLAPQLLHPILENIILSDEMLQFPKCEIKVAPQLLPVLGHPVLLHQCLCNLLQNAAKFVAPGTTPQINVWTEAKPGRVRIWVEDNGVGIDLRYRSIIYRPFERVGNTKRYPGTGLGLAIVARATERMHGTYGVESTLDVGSRFWIELESPANGKKGLGHPELVC